MSSFIVSLQSGRVPRNFRIENEECGGGVCGFQVCKKRCVERSRSVVKRQCCKTLLAGHVVVRSVVEEPRALFDYGGSRGKTEEGESRGKSDCVDLHRWVVFVFVGDEEQRRGKWAVLIGHSGLYLWNGDAENTNTAKLRGLRRCNVTQNGCPKRVWSSPIIYIDICISHPALSFDGFVKTEAATNVQRIRNSERAPGSRHCFPSG